MKKTVTPITCARESYHVRNVPSTEGHIDERLRVKGRISGLYQRDSRAGELRWLPPAVIEEATGFTFLSL
jgi:hypothetical protein